MSPLRPPAESRPDPATSNRAARFGLPAAAALLGVPIAAALLGTFVQVLDAALARGPLVVVTTPSSSMRGVGRCDGERAPRAEQALARHDGADDDLLSCIDLTALALR